ncbi:unnamed protein product, partial [Trichobilharzia szidati]
MHVGHKLVHNSHSKSISSEKVAKLHQAIFGKHSISSSTPNKQPTKLEVQRPTASNDLSELGEMFHLTPKISINPSNHLDIDNSHDDIIKFNPVYSPKSVISLKKNGQSSYGILLRRGLLTHRLCIFDNGIILEDRTEVLLTECDRQNSSNCFLPGDYLVAVGDELVNSMARNEVVQLIRCCGHSLCLTVQLLPEFLEFYFRLVFAHSSDSPNIKTSPKYVQGDSRCIILVSVRNYVVKYGSFKNLYIHLQQFQLNS